MQSNQIVMERSLAAILLTKRKRCYTLMICSDGRFETNQTDKWAKSASLLAEKERSRNEGVFMPHSKHKGLQNNFRT